MHIWVHTPDVLLSCHSPPGRIVLLSRPHPVRSCMLASQRCTARTSSFLGHLFKSFNPSPLLLRKTSFQRGWKPLHFAAQGGHLECVELLLHNKARATDVTKVSRHSVNARVRWFAPVEPADDIEDHLYTRAFSQFFLSNLNMQNYINLSCIGAHVTLLLTLQDCLSTPLHVAADVGFVDVCRRLLEEEVDLESRDVVSSRDSTHHGDNFAASSLQANGKETSDGHNHVTSVAHQR